METPSRTQFIATTIALKQLVVRRCLEQISLEQFARDCAAMVAQARHMADGSSALGASTEVGAAR